AVYGALVFINIRGVREGAGAVTVITFAKLLPLLLFICAGLFFIHAPNLSWSGWPGSKPLGDAVVLLMFAFVGIEVALIPSGEVKNPSRTVPRSAYLALVVTTIVYILIQVVAQGTLGGDLAIVTYAAIAFVLSVSGSFERLAVLSNVAVLLMYLLCCAGCWFLMQRDVRADGEPLNFPGMKAVPALAIIVILTILVQSSLSQSQIGSDTRAGLLNAVIVLAIASVFYLVRMRLRRKS